MWHFWLLAIRHLVEPAMKCNLRMWCNIPQSMFNNLLVTFPRPLSQPMTLGSLFTKKSSHALQLFLLVSSRRWYLLRGALDVPEIATSKVTKRVRHWRISSKFPSSIPFRHSQKLLPTAPYPCNKNHYCQS